MGCRSVELCRRLDPLHGPHQDLRRNRLQGRHLDPLYNPHRSWPTTRFLNRVRSPAFAPRVNQPINLLLSLHLGPPNSLHRNQLLVPLLEVCPHNSSSRRVLSPPQPSSHRRPVDSTIGSTGRGHLVQILPLALPIARRAYGKTLFMTNRMVLPVLVAVSWCMQWLRWQVLSQLCFGR
jgi:hypothetical protein